MNSFFLFVALLFSPFFLFSLFFCGLKDENIRANEPILPFGFLGWLLDDILVTAKGYENLTTAPKEIAEIEQIISGQ